jgi:probable F420-dependent oxidoreductase
VEDASLQPKPRQHPQPPLFVGGGGRRVLTLAAREADIVGIDPKGTAAGTKDLATTSAEELERKVGWVREAAGARFPALELHILVAAVVVTDDRQQGAEQVASLLATYPPHLVSNAPTAEHVRDWPQALIGTVDQIADDLRARRERFGISYYTVFGDYTEALAPIVARLAGT